MGRSVALPRLTAWYGDRDYRYSGIDNQPAPWPDILAPLRSNLEEWAGVTFNAVLLNRYRDGRDSISWHSDAEASLGPNPLIASVSLGAPRRFKLKHRRGRFPSVDVDLRHGDVLIMAGASQHHWLHAVPKTAKPVGERLNLTFRRIVVAPSGLRGE